MTETVEFELALQREVTLDYGDEVGSQWVPMIRVCAGGRWSDWSLAVDHLHASGLSKSEAAGKLVARARELRSVDMGGVTVTARIVATPLPEYRSDFNPHGLV